MIARKTRSGFTLMEVAVAGFLVALLSACVFRGILTVKQNSQALAQRIAAQGLCLQRYEEMKAVAFDNIDRIYFPETNVLLASLSKDPTKGRLLAEISNAVNSYVQDDLPVKDVDIVCRWTFRGREHTETLRGKLVDGYSTYAVAGSLDNLPIDLNPNYELPQMLYVRTVDGTVYTQLNIETLPLNTPIRATTVVVMPGGGKRQTVSYGVESKSVSNGKTLAFTSASLADPVVMTVRTSQDTIQTADGDVEVTRYHATLSCGNASISYK